MTTAKIGNLSHSDKKYNSLIGSTPDVIGELELDGTISFVSQQVNDMLGYHPDEMIGENIIKLTHPDDVPVITKNIKKAIKSKKVVIPKLRLKHKQGNYILVFVMGKLIKLTDKPRLISVIRDITKIDETEKKLEESQNIFEQLNEVFLKFKEDPIINLQLLINAAGLLLNADCALFNIFKRVNGKDVLESLVTYNEPPNFTRESDPKGHICTDIIKDNPDDAVILRNLDKTDYMKTDENVRNYGLKQYVSYAVRFNNKPTATFCVVYTENREMSNNDLSILHILSKSASTELARWNSRIDLQESEEKYRSLVEGLDEALYRMSLPDGNYSYFSPAAKQVFGYSSKDFLNNPMLIKKIIHPDFSDYFNEKWADLLIGNIPRTYEYKIIDPDNKERWIKQSNKMIFDSDGNFSAIEGLCRNITARKEAKQKLRESEDKYKNLFDQSPFALVLINLDGKLEECNAQAEKLFGYSNEEILGKDFRKLNIFSPDNLPKLAKSFKKFIKTGVPEPSEFQIYKKDGTSTWIHTNPIIIKMAGSSYVLVTLQDLTPHKKSEEQIHYQATLIENVSDAIISTDINFNILSWNIAAENMYGWSAKEVIGKNINDTISIEYLYDKRENVLKTFFRKGFWQGEVIQPKKDNSKIYVYSSVKLLKDAIGNPIGAVAINHDISDLKKTEEKLKESEDKFRNIAEQNLMGIGILQDNTIKYINKAMADIYGYSVEEMLNWEPMEFFKIFAPDTLEIANEQGLKKQTGDPTQVIHYKIHGVKKTGELIWVDNFSISITYEGRPADLITQIDITEKVSVEQKLKESEARYKDLFENSPISLWEEDFSLVKNYIDNLKNSGIKDLREFFKKNPEELKKCVSMVKIVNVNKKTLELYKVDNIESFFFMLSEIFTEESLAVFMEEIIAFAEGKTRFESEAITKTMNRDKFPILKVVEIVDGFQKDWSKVLVSIINITDLKKMEQNLKESEAKWRSITENSPDHILTMDRDAKITFINYTVPDLTIDEVIGKSYYDFVQEDFKESQRKHLKEVMETGKPHHFETGYVDKDGNQFYFDVRSRPIWEEDKIIGIINHSSNITEQKKKEEEIRLQSEIITNMSEGVYLIRLEDSIIVYANPRFEEMFGYDPGEMIGKNVIIVNAPTDKTPEETKNEIVGILKDTGEWHGEVLNIKKDGTPFWCYANVSLFDHPEHGSVIVSVHTDITKKKEVEEERNRFFNLSLHILLIAKLDGTILRTNPGWTEILGYDESDLLGIDFKDLIHPDDREKAIFEMERLSKGIITKHFENRYRRKDGSYRTLAWSAVPHLDTKTVYIIAYDVSKQKRIESEIIESEKKIKDLIDAVPLGITISNPEGKIFEANSCSIEMFGFDSKEEFLNTPANKFFADPTNRLQYVQLLENGPVREFETKFKHKNGKLFWGSLTSIAKTVGDEIIIFNTLQDISERKIDEEIIADLAKFPAENPNPVLRISKKEYVLYTNQAGKNLFQAKIGNEIPLVLKNEVRIAFNENKNIISKIRLNNHIYSIFITPIEETEYVNVYGMDITEHTIVEQKLKDSQKNFKLLNEELEIILDNLPGLVFFKDIKNNFIKVNQYVANAHEMTKSELEGVSLFDLYPKDQAQKYLDDDLEVIKSKKPKLDFIEPWDVEEGRRWVNTIKIPLFDENNKCIGIIGFSTDVTAQVKSEQRLRESEEKYRSLVETAEMGLVELNFIENRVSYINPRLLKILGYTKDEFFEEKIFIEIVHPEDLEDLIRSSEDRHVEFRIYTKDQKLRWLSGIRSNQYDKEGNIINVRLWLEDTTERKEIEEIKSDLLIRFSHEFNTPLISIMGFTDFLLTSYKDKFDEKILAFLRNIKNGSERLKTLINTFIESSHLDRDFSKLELSSENFLDFVKTAVKEVKELADLRNHVIEVNVPEDVMVEIDKEKIYTVITNLILNAIKYTPIGGKILIRSKIDGDFNSLSIIDNGIGFTSSEKEKLFEKFGKIERYGHGWDIISDGIGMGLYISKQIITEHEGKIWVESQGIDRGSTFTFTIPIRKNKNS